MTRYDIMAFLRENAYPYYQDPNAMRAGEWQDKMYNALFQSLPDEMLAEVCEQMLLEKCPRSLYYKANAILSTKIELRDAHVPTSVLLRLYQDKNSKKVNWAMKELMRRYRGEEQDKQRLILRAFLCGGKKEIEWAGRRLRVNWIPSFASLVGECWKATHNTILAYVVLRHMPSAFVLEQQEELAEVTKYAYVCARLGNDPAFHFDSERLTIPEYFYVMAKLNASHTPMINTSVVLEFMLQEYLDEEVDLEAEDVKTLLWAMGKLGMTESIIRFRPEFENRLKKCEEQNRLLFSNAEGMEF